MLNILLAFIVVLVSIRAALELYRRYHRKPFVWLTGNKWAVVTGATDGIGYEFARQLAHKGYNLMLLSRSEPKLELTKEKILADSSRRIQIRTHAVDFTRTDIYNRIEAFLDVRKHDIYILVNNVGTCCDCPEYFLNGNYKVRNEQLINCNLISLTKMTELVLPSMVDKKRGLVINISSLAALQPTFLLATYSATKAFMNKLSECLAEEYRRAGVIFCTLPIWVVSTNMTHNIEHPIWMPSARKYVQSALASIKYQESCQITGYLPHTILEFLTLLIGLVLPSQLIASSIQWYTRQMKRQFKEIDDRKSANAVDSDKVSTNLLHVLFKS